MYLAYVIIIIQCMNNRIDIDFSAPVAWIIITTLFKVFKVVNIPWKMVFIPPLIWLLVVIFIILIIFNLKR